MQGSDAIAEILKIECVEQVFCFPFTPIIEAVKPAEDGSRDIVVRMYEAKRSATRCTLSTSLPVVRAAQTDMLENVQRGLELQDGKLALEFRPFEIKTVRFRPALPVASVKLSKSRKTEGEPISSPGA